ncbi:MAG: restriction endonuclease subunit S, partial [Fusobacteriaceae bacterium]
NNELLISLEKLFGNFEKVIKTKEDVKDIRNLVLSLAVRGKLVPQIEDEEPASELLQKIKEEKERLISEKVIKKEKPLLPITEDEKPYNIPNSWEWVRLGDVIQIVNGVTYNKKNVKLTKEKEYGFVIRGGNIQKDTFVDIHDNTFIPKDLIKEEQYIKTGDTLMVSSSGTLTSVGKSIYVLKKMLDTTIGAFLIILRPKIVRSSKFFHIYLKIIRNRIISDLQGTSISNIKRTVIENYLITLPPLEEQERIVKRVDELMAVCDVLESKIEMEENINHKLLASLLK